MSYAFPNKEIPPPKLESLMVQIVKKCEGLPLKLEVLGQWLKRRRGEEVWRQTLDSLHDAEDVEDFNLRLWAKLMPSIDGLGENALQMFLDATLFFYNNGKQGGWTLRDAQAAWREAYGVRERLLWETLVDRSLVYDVKEDEPIKVHEQLRSLGRNISTKSDKSQVLEISSALRLLLCQKESDKKTLQNVHALRLERSPRMDKEAIHLWLSVPLTSALPAAVANLEEDRSQTFGSSEASTSKNEVKKEMDVLRASIEAETNLEEDTFVDRRVNTSRLGLQKLEKLRYLDVSGKVVYGGDGVTNWLPSSLVVLRCQYIDSLNLVHQRRLAVLKICGGEMRSLPNSIGQLTALRILVIKLPYLESIPDEIGDLSNLEVLDIHPGPFVRNLPETLGKLSKLRILVLRWCSFLKTLPESFKQLCALERLEFVSCGFKTLPNSFAELSALNSLRISWCMSLECLPESFGRLPALTDLIVSKCNKLKSLPETFGHLPALRRLEFRDCSNLQSLPKSLGELPVLNHLEFVSCDELQFLPESLSQLEHLEYLEIRDCGKLDSLPDSLAKVITLRHLIIKNNSRMKSVPDWIQNLPSLHTVELGRGEREKYHGELMSTSHSKALEKVEASDFHGALAGFSVINVSLLPYRKRAFFLQERGILKRLAGDFGGALEDLTAALEIDRDDYELLKHRAYVKYLLGDLDGARMDAETCLKVEYDGSGEKRLAQASVAFLEFDLK